MAGAGGVAGRAVSPADPSHATASRRSLMKEGTMQVTITGGTGSLA
jgi:hypothetical protein